MHFAKLILSLSVALLCIGSANAEFYTVTQTILIPGQGYNILLISIFDDKGTPKKSDDLHMKTDVFIRWNTGQNDAKQSDTKNAEQEPMTNIIPGNMAEFAKALIHTAEAKDERVLNYLLKIAQGVDKCNTTNDCQAFFNRMSNAPEYFKPYIINLDSTVNMQEYLLESISDEKNE